MGEFFPAIIVMMLLDSMRCGIIEQKDKKESEFFYLLLLDNVFVWCGFFLL